VVQLKTTQTGHSAETRLSPPATVGLVCSVCLLSAGNCFLFIDCQMYIEVSLVIGLYPSPLLPILMHWLLVLHVVAVFQPNDTSDWHGSRLSRNPVWGSFAIILQLMPTPWTVNLYTTFKNPVSRVILHFLHGPKTRSETFTNDWSTRLPPTLMQTYFSSRPECMCVCVCVCLCFKLLRVLKLFYRFGVYFCHHLYNVCNVIS